MSALSSKANEPSMEEILASIRRIISDDESRIAASQNVAQAVVERASPEPQHHAPQAPQQQAPQFVPQSYPQAVQPAPVAVADYAPVMQAPEPAPTPAYVAPQFDAQPQQPTTERRNPEAGWTGKEGLQELSYYQESARKPEIRAGDARLQQEELRERTAPQPVEQAVVVEPYTPTISGDTDRAVKSALRTLSETTRAPSISVEELVIASIRPMLGEWLDKNLPGMVERIVREEIDRIARQARF